MPDGVSWKEKLLSAIFPARCALCGRITRGGRRVCARCQEKNPPNAQFRRLEAGSSGLEVFCVTPYVYKGQVRKAILQFKFRGKREKAAGLSEALVLALPPRWQTADTVCWVPLSDKRLRERGYDQSELLARKVAKEIGRPCRKLLTKIQENQVQHTLRREERKKNVQGVYRADGGQIYGKRILLIDDIVTTGSTLGECAGELYRAGAAEVHCAAVVTSIGDGNHEF